MIVDSSVFAECGHIESMLGRPAQMVGIKFEERDSERPAEIVLNAGLHE